MDTSGVNSGPEPDRSCQCTGPECVESEAVKVSCDNEMDAEDLLCTFCRENKEVKHCHVFSIKCPTPKPVAIPEEEYPFKGLSDYQNYIVEYIRKRYARFGQ